VEGEEDRTEISRPTNVRDIFGVLHSELNFPNLIHFKNINYKVGRKNKGCS
jgi:hypothetical protein